MRVTQSLVILLALFAGTTARTRGGVRRPRLSTFTSPIEAELQIEFSKPLRILKARATDDSEAMEPAKRMGMMGRKTPAPTFSTPPSPAHVDSPTKAPKASKPPTPTKPPKEEKTKAPTPTKAPKASKPPTPIKPPKGEKASKPPTPTKEPKRDKGVKDVSEDSPVEEEGEGVEDLTAVDSESALLDEPKLEERSLSLAAFEYVTLSIENPGKQDYEELARVTAEIFDETYESYFEDTADVKYDFVELQRYTPLTPRLVQFKVSTYFHRPELIPSLLEIEDIASQGLKSGSEYYNRYLTKLRGSNSPVFSTVTSVRFINNQADLKVAEARTSEEEDQVSWWSESFINFMVPIVVAFFALFTCIFCVRYCRERRRPLTLEELEELEAKVATNRDLENASASSSTYASEYRMSVFSDCETEEKTMNTDTKRAMSDICELSLEDELDHVMDELEEVPLCEEAVAVHTATSAPRVTITWIPPTPAPVSAVSKDADVSSKPVSTPYYRGKPEWMTKKLKTVPKPPAYIDITTKVKDPESQEGKLPSKNEDHLASSTVETRDETASMTKKPKSVVPKASDAPDDAPADTADATTVSQSDSPFVASPISASQTTYEVPPTKEVDVRQSLAVSGQAKVLSAPTDPLASVQESIEPLVEVPIESNIGKKLENLNTPIPISEGAQDEVEANQQDANVPEWMRKFKEMGLDN